jgi:8-amino-7-oxononanoate synthase
MVSGQAPSRMVNGKLFFSGTSYLGLSQNKDFKALINQGIKKYGLSYGISRNGNYKLDVFSLAEAQMANFLGQESVLLVSSGMLAGQTLIRHFNALGYTIEYAPGTHQALWLHPNQQSHTKTFGQWVQWALTTSFASPTVLCLNSLDALTCQPWPLDFLSALAQKPNLTLIVDHSHGLGIIALPSPSTNNIYYVASTHKGLSTPGGLIAGNTQTISTIKNSGFFSSGSPMLPACAFVLANIPLLLKKASQTLRGRVELFMLLIRNHLAQFSFYKDHAVFYTRHHGLYAFLLANDIFIYHFAYPDPQGVPNTRIVISAWHSTADIRKLSSAVNAYFSSISLHK